MSARWIAILIILVGITIILHLAFPEVIQVIHMAWIMTGTLFSVIIAIVIYVIGEYFHERKIKAEKFLEWLHDLNKNFYFPLSTYSYNLSEALHYGDLENDELMLKWCIYLIYEYLRHGQKLVKSIGGNYLLPSIDGIKLTSKLSERIRDLLLDCFGEKLQELTNLDFPNFSEFNKYLEKNNRDLLEKFKKWVKVEKHRKELMVFTNLYSEILSANSLLSYGEVYSKIKKEFKVKKLHEQAKKILDIYDKLDTINRNIKELSFYVNKFAKKGYKSEDICEIKVSKPIVVFDGIFGFVKFKNSFPWLIRVKKTEQGVSPITIFIYSTKYEYIEDALEKSQRLKEKLKDELSMLLVNL